MSINKPTPTSVRLLLSIKPNARTSSFTGVTTSSISLQINAPPRDGEANNEVVRFVSKALGFRRSNTKILKGAKGREKVFLIEGISDDVDDVRRKVEELVEE